MNDDLVSITRQDFNDLAWTSMRYALGRKTYMVSEVCNILIKNADKLYPGNRQQSAEEIKIAIDSGSAGMPMDVKEWQKVLDAFEKLKNDH